MILTFIKFFIFKISTNSQIDQMNLMLTHISGYAPMDPYSYSQYYANYFQQQQQPPKPGVIGKVDDSAVVIS